MSAAHGPHDEYVATKAWDSAVMRRLMRYASPHRRLFLTSFLVLAGLFALQLFAPWILKSAVDGPVRSAQEARLFAGEDVDAGPYLAALGWWAGGYLLVICLAAVFRYWETSQLTRTGQAVWVRVVRRPRRRTVSLGARASTAKQTI